MEHLDLTIIWAGIIGFAVFAYVVMDGFDLGIGILFPSLSVGGERDQAMNSIAPVWDGNETWLVLGGGGLFAAFPLAYAIILPATYPLIIAMLLGLVFRGVAFEFRWRDPRHRPFWDVAFSFGSVLAAFSQGITLGAILQGVRVEADASIDALGALPALQTLFVARAKELGSPLTKSAFSFRSPQGRCPTCKGTGRERVPLEMLADLQLPCPTCRGARYRPEVLAVRWQGATIAELLDEPVAALLGRRSGRPPHASAAPVARRRRRGWVW